MFPVTPDSRADALGADVARRAGGCHGTLSNWLLGDSAGPGQVGTSCSHYTVPSSAHMMVIINLEKSPLLQMYKTKISLISDINEFVFVFL